METFESLGDKCKAAEDNETLRSAKPDEVIMVRLDGHSFSKFTKGLKRPYDERLSKLMIDTVKFIVQKTGAVVGFTQSDEISLVFKTDDADPNSHYFAGRFQKIATTCSAYATSYFNKHLAEVLPEKTDQYPCFDGRVWSVPSLREAYENLLWRERDATKNSISMAAQSYFNHTELHGIDGLNKKQMLLDKGVNWNDYPAFFKRGTYVRRMTTLKNLTEKELEQIPVENRPTGPISRTEVVTLDLPPLHLLNDYASDLFQKTMNTCLPLRNGDCHIAYSD